MRTLAIVGSHPATRDLAPFDDPNYEIWVFNEAAQAPWCKRWDVAFQLHKPEVYMSPNNYSNAAHWDWLQQNHGRKVVYMQEYDELVPNSRGYPLEAIRDTLPGAVMHLDTGDVTWIDSTPSYALILALYLGYRDIHVWGVELSSNTEYYRQLPNWVYWCGVAEGMGVNLVLHSGHVHFQTPLYGYQGEVQLDKPYYKSRLDLLEPAFKQAEKALWKIKERIDGAILGKEPQKLAPLVMQLRDIATQAGQLSGAIAEAQKCYNRTDPIPRQEMEKRAAQAQKDGEEKQGVMFHNSGKLELAFNQWIKSGFDIGLRDQMKRFMAEATQAAYDTGAMHGIYQENLEYMAELDKLTDAAGGEKTLAALNMAR